MAVASRRRRVSIASLAAASVTLVGATTVDRPAAATTQSESAKPCEPAEVGSLIVRFIDAFNAGNVKRLDRVFAREPDFRWYATDAPGQRFRAAAEWRAGLMRYLRGRHALGERLQLRSLKVNGNSAGFGKPQGNFEHWLVRSANDLPQTDYHGKGVLHCYASRADQLIVWVMTREN
jgi:hypothetical protein